MRSESVKVIAFLSAMCLALSAVQAAEVDVNKLIREVDRMYRSNTSYAEFEMEIITPHWQRTMLMDAWSEGMEKTFIRIKKPLKEKGMATLRVENEMWNFLPKTDKVIKIPPSMMMGSWMGSDFTNDDLVKESSLFHDYSYELIDVDSAQDKLYYINCIPREDLAVVWGNIVIAVNKADSLPVWQKYYDEKGELMRVMRYSEVTMLGGRRIPAVMEVIPEHKEGHRTIVRYLQAEFDVLLEEDTFTLRNLRASK